MSIVGGYPQAFHGSPVAHNGFYHYPPPACFPDSVSDLGQYYPNWVQGQTDGSMEMYPSLVDPGIRAEYSFVDGSTRYTGERTVKRRSTANKKERRRTISINTAFSDLRECIPNVPSDTKLSKIKTLRLATSYIAYLTEVLSKDDPALLAENFKAELVTKHVTKHFNNSKEEKKRREIENTELYELSPSGVQEDKKPKGRTGWPQQVWAMELQQ